jgi:two-component system cell cycle sensor histidine kinase/response regulator CckA
MTTVYGTKRLHLVSLVCVVLASRPTHLVAQTTSVIQGTVTDQQGGVIGLAALALSGRMLGEDITVVTSNAAGSYRVPGLQAGIYNLRVAESGFAARDNATVSSTGATVLPQQIEQMRINGRNYLVTILLAVSVLLTLIAYHRSRQAIAANRALENESRERLLVAEALRHSEHRLRSILDAEPECVTVVAVDGTLLELNRAGLAMVEAESAEEIIGKSIYPLVVPEHQGAVRDFAREVCQGGTKSLEFDLVGGKGTRRTMDCRGVPFAIGSDGVVSMLAVAHDISERKRLEERHRLGQRMESVGRLAGGVAHDFNNLLTIITGYSEMLLGGLESQNPARASLEEIKNAAERAAGLTHQLLAFSRQQVLAPQVLDLNVAIAKMDKMLRRLIGEDIDLVASSGADLGQVKADPGQIEQIIMNLAVNARDAMPGGGKLTIEASNVDLEAVHTHASVTITPGPYVMLAVTDTGSGMDKETQARIFDPFFTTKELGKGTGLGLATVYGIVKQSGGFIWVYSELGVGTTFKIYLPRVEESARTVDPLSARQTPDRGSETILVVEDDESLRSLIRTVLKANGYTVLEASRGEEALEICKNHPGAIDLILTDVVMPQMNGRELANRMVSARPETRVLYMSGYTDNAIVHHGVLDEGTAFLQKPFTPAALARKVREVLVA